MHLPGVLPFLFLTYALLFLPWVVVRSKRFLDKAGEALPPGSLTSPRFLLPTLFTQGLLVLLAGLTARQIDFAIFRLPAPGWWTVQASGIALALCLTLLPIARWIHPEAERRQMILLFLAPHTWPDRMLWGITVLTASVCEEVAFRGVGVTLLSDLTGARWLAVLLCALAFGATHAIQGWKAGVIVVGIALILQALVSVTGSLVPAMIVHALLDFVAIGFIGREARRLGIFELPAAPDRS